MNDNGEGTFPNELERDFCRENAAYEVIKAELERDSMGKGALMYGDDLVGVFDDLNSAVDEGRRRFGLEQFMVREIGDPVYEMGLGVLPAKNKIAAA